MGPYSLMRVLPSTVANCGVLERFQAITTATTIKIKQTPATLAAMAINAVDDRNDDEPTTSSKEMRLESGNDLTDCR